MLLHFFLTIYVSDQLALLIRSCLGDLNFNESYALFIQHRVSHYNNTRLTPSRPFLWTTCSGHLHPWPMWKKRRRSLPIRIGRSIHSVRMDYECSGRCICNPLFTTSKLRGRGGACTGLIYFYFDIYDLILVRLKERHFHHPHSLHTYVSHRRRS